MTFPTKHTTNLLSSLHLYSYHPTLELLRIRNSGKVLDQCLLTDCSPHFSPIPTLQEAVPTLGPAYMVLLLPVKLLSPLTWLPLSHPWGLNLNVYLFKPFSCFAPVSFSFPSKHLSPVGLFVGPCNLSSSNYHLRSMRTAITYIWFISKYPACNKMPTH